MTEKLCAICLSEVTSSYILIGEQYYHIECFARQARIEEPQTEIFATLLELLTIHGF